jgi:hypothetical protein
MMGMMGRQIGTLTVERSTSNEGITGGRAGSLKHVVFTFFYTHQKNTVANAREKMYQN